MQSRSPPKFNSSRCLRRLATVGAAVAPAPAGAAPAAATLVDSQVIIQGPKSVVLTGANRGIGLEFARQCESMQRLSLRSLTLAQKLW